MRNEIKDAGMSDVRVNIVFCLLELSEFCRKKRTFIFY